MPWQRGRETIERLLESDELEQVTPSEGLAARLMDDATVHLESAEAIRATDPTGAYQLAYDAALGMGCAIMRVVDGVMACVASWQRSIQSLHLMLARTGSSRETPSSTPNRSPYPRAARTDCYG